MAFRSSIQDFALANNIYIGAVVAFYTVNSLGQATETLAPLFADPTSSTQLPNPQILDSTGKFFAPVYIELPVIGEVQGPSISTHSTGIINPRGTWRGNWVTATQYYSEDFIQDPATGNLWIAALDYISSGAITTDIGAGNLVLGIDQTPLTTEGANLAIKMPARVATTGGNIVLSGLGTLDGVTLNSGDRVLVKDQTTKTTNGIYVALSGAWALASDFMTSAMLTQGAQVFVTSGAINGLSTWSLATANPIVLGTSNIVFTYGRINDTSSVLSSGAAFWSPTWAGFPGTGVIDRFNRVFVGSATAASSDYLSSTALPTVPGWLDTLFNQAIQGTAQFASASALGITAILGYARTSDFYNYGSVPSQGSQGGMFVAYNDDLVGTNAIADAILGIAIQRSGGTGLTTLATQLDINAATQVDIQAYATGGNPNGGYNGETIGALITSGAYSTFAKAKPSAAIFLGYGGYKTFRKGIVVGPTTLDTTVGAGAGGLFADLPRGASLRWQNSLPGVDSEIWGDANGFNINSKSLLKGQVTILQPGIGMSGPTTAGDGLFLENVTAAAAGVQQNSPNIHFQGQGWKTASTAASQATDWFINVAPVQGSSAPTSQLQFSSSIGAGSVTTQLTLTNAGGVQFNQNASNPSPTGATKGVGIIAPDTTNAGFSVATYGAVPSNSFIRNGGTFSSPVAVSSGNVLGELTFQGATSSSSTITGATITCTAAEAWSTTAYGTYFSIFTTVTGGGSPSTTEKLRIQASGGLNVGNHDLATDVGAGNILLSGNGSSLGGVAAFYYAGTEYGRLQAGSVGITLAVNAGITQAVTAYTSGGVYIGATSSDPGANNMTVQGGMVVGAATGGQLGAGKINVAGGIYLNNTAYTNPDYALERYFTGRIERFADKPGAKSYGGLMPLHDLESYLRDSLRLPGIGDEPADIFSRADIALEKIEEATLYLLELHNRTAALEARLH